MNLESKKNGFLQKYSENLAKFLCMNPNGFMRNAANFYPSYWKAYHQNILYTYHFIGNGAHARSQGSSREKSVIL